MCCLLLPPKGLDFLRNTLKTSFCPPGPNASFLQKTWGFLTVFFKINDLNLSSN